MPNIRIWGITDQGRHRTRNEDAIAWDVGSRFAVLADGVGGRNSGDVASRLVVSILEDRLRAARDDDVERRLAAAVSEANSQIYRHSHAYPIHAGMGSTVVAVHLLARQLVVAHVGDSRLYRFRAGVLECLTRDHSLVQELVSDGLLTPEEARVSGHRNIITRALGSAPAVNVELRRHDTRAGDRLLLCSDGLSDLATDDEIAAVLARGTEPEVTALDLVAMANARGGTDNISVIIVELD